VTRRRWELVSDITLVAGMLALWALGYSPELAVALCLLAVLVGLVGALIADALVRR